MKKILVSVCTCYLVIVTTSQKPQWHRKCSDDEMLKIAECADWPEHRENSGHFPYGTNLISNHLLTDSWNSTCNTKPGSPSPHRTFDPQTRSEKNVEMLRIRLYLVWFENWQTQIETNVLSMWSIWLPFNDKFICVCMHKYIHIHLYLCFKVTP